MKKVVSLVLAASLAIGASAMTFGATKNNFDDTAIGLSGPIVKRTGKGENDYHPEDTVKYYITYGLNANGAKLVQDPTDSTKSYYAATRTTISDGKVDVRIRSTEGSAAFENNPKIKYESNGAAYVELKFVKEFVSTKELDFDVNIYLTSDKSRLDGKAAADFSGTFENYKTNVGENDDYVNLVDNPVVEADDYVKNIQVYLGQGVSIYTKLFDGKKYYGHVSQDVKAEDEAVLAQYPNIATVYYLTTIGLNASGETVKIDDYTSNAYVYTKDENGDLVYVGRTNDRLPYYTKYFLSAKELDVDVAIDEEDDDILVPGEDDEDEIINPGTGGDGEAPANVNDNPSTGR